MQMNLTPNTQLPIDHINGVAIHYVWQNVTEQLQVRLTQFWLENKAISNANEAKRRAQEVVLVALNAQHEIVGVSTVYIHPFGKLPQPYYFFRTFIQPSFRSVALLVRLVKHTKTQLVQYQLSLLPDLENKTAIASSSVQGMVIVTDNMHLKLARINRWLLKQGFVLQGLTPDKKEVWSYLFVR